MTSSAQLNNATVNKSLGLPYQPTTKGLGSSVNASPSASSPGSDMGTWLENAYSYMNWWQEVQSGQAQLQPGETLATPLQIQDLQKEIQWAVQQMGGGAAQGWGDNYGPQDPTQEQSNLPPGAKIGPMNNIVFNQATAETTYSASSTPIDVMSDEFTLNVDVKVKQVDVEKTTDSRLNPPSDVIKITVTDPSSIPSTTTYFVQPDAKININTVGGKGVVQHDTEGLKLEDHSPQITVGSYDPTISADGSSNESSIPGEKQADGSLLYNGQANQVIEFAPTQHGKGTKPLVHDVYGNADITPLASDHCVVVPTSVDSEGKANEMSLVITHADGSQDIYKIHKGYKVNLNASSEYVAYGSILGVGPEGTDVPDMLKNIFTLSSNGTLAGTGTTSSSSQISAGQPVGPSDMSAPNEVDDKTAIYSQPKDVDLTANYDGSVNTYNITTTSDHTVTLNTATLNDTVAITKNPDGTYSVVMSKNGDSEHQVTFIVQGPPSKIVINALPDKITYNGEPYASIAGTDPKISVSGETPANVWPTTVVDNIPSGGDHNLEAIQFASLMDTAIASGDWSAVGARFDSLRDFKNLQQSGDVIRKFMTALYSAVGEDDAKFKAALQMIPKNYRQYMVDILTGKNSEDHTHASHFDKVRNKQSGDQWDSSDLAVEIEKSLAE